MLIKFTTILLLLTVGSIGLSDFIEIQSRTFKSKFKKR